jgi:hypothetical protein
MANQLKMEEEKEHMRIYLEAAKAKLSTGTVHVYVVAPDGQPLDSQHVATATKVDQLIAMLERTVDRLKTPPGKALVPVSNQARKPKTTDAIFCSTSLPAMPSARETKTYPTGPSLEKPAPATGGPTRRKTGLS